MGEKSKGLYNFYISYADDGHSWVHGTLLPRLNHAAKTYLLEDAASNVGEFWLQAMQDNIQQSERVVVVLSPQYLLTHQKQFITVMTMTKGVEERNWPLVPILLKGANADLVLRSLNVIDLTDDDEEEDGVRLNALLGGEWDKPLVALSPPYPGMKAFEEDESAHFFGREAEISRYIEYLRLNHFLGLIGPSGCGKSSLVRAGIVPILKKRSYCDLFGGGDWAVHVFRAGSPDFHAWLALFSGSNGTETERVQELLSAGEDQASRLLLVIDQFEELFSLDKPEEGRRQGRLGEKAIQTLQQLARLVGVPSVYVILTVRDEFYPQIILCQEWLKLHAHLHPVGSLSRKGLQDAIVLPARGVGVYIQDELVERLLNDAGDDPGILPFVQETMRSLWARMEAREITLASYEALGTKEVNGLRHSIAARADSAFNSLPSDKHKDIAKRIFIRLIQFGEGRPDTRRQQSVTSLKAGQESDLIFDETVDILSSENSRLLTVSKRKSGDGFDVVIDIVHESLIKAWPLLSDLIISYKDIEFKRRAFDVKFKEWKRLGAKVSGLLDKEEITEVENIVGKGEKYLFSLSTEEASYIALSKKQINPGWNSKGLGYVLVLLGSLLSVFAYSGMLILEINDSKTKSLSWLFLGLLLFVIFALYYNIRKSTHFFEQKITNSILIGYKNLIFVVLTFGVSFGLWLVHGLDVLSFNNRCGYWVADDKKDMGIVFIGDMNQISIDYLIKSVSMNGLNVKAVDEKEFSICRDIFDFGFYVEKHSVLNKDETYDISYSIKNKTGHFVESTKTIKSEDDCKALIDIGNLLEKLAGVSNPFVISDYSVSKSCFEAQNSKESIDNYVHRDFDASEKSMLDNANKYPNDYLYKLNLSKIYLKKKEYSKAHQYAVQATNLHESPDTLNALAKACRFLKDYGCGENNLKKSISLNEENYDTYNQLAQLYKDRKLGDDLEKALVNIDKAISHCDAGGKEICYAYLKNKGVILYYMQDYDQSMSILDKLNDDKSIYQEDIYYYRSIIYKINNNHKGYCNNYNLYVSNESKGLSPDSDKIQSFFEENKSLCMK